MEKENMNENKEVIGNEVIENKEVIEAEVVETPVEEPEVLVVNKTTFSKDGYTQMNKEVSKRSYTLVAACEVILAGFAVYFFVKQQWLYGGLISGLVVLYPFLLIFLSKRQLDRTFKTYSNVFDNAVYTYNFRSDDLKINFESKGTIQDGVIKYSAIYRLIENKDYLFIFISSNQSYIVSKAGFENEEDVNKVIDLIKSKGVKVKKNKDKKSK